MVYPSWRLRWCFFSCNGTSTGESLGTLRNLLGPLRQLQVWASWWDGTRRWGVRLRHQQAHQWPSKNPPPACATGLNLAAGRLEVLRLIWLIWCSDSFGENRPDLGWSRMSVNEQHVYGLKDVKGPISWFEWENGKWELSGSKKVSAWSMWQQESQESRHSAQ